MPKYTPCGTHCFWQQGPFMDKEGLPAVTLAGEQVECSVEAAKWAESVLMVRLTVVDPPKAKAKGKGKG